MNFKSIIITIAFLISPAMAYGSEQWADDIKSLSSLLADEAPEDIQYLMNSHHKEVEEAFKGSIRSKTCSFPWLPGYIVKATPADYRVAGAELIKQIVAQHPETMNLITVPIQYSYIGLYRRYTIAEKEEGAIPYSYKLYTPSYLERLLGLAKQPIQLNLEQTKQLCNFIIASGWQDSRRDNYALRSNGKISIIDTEVFDFETKNDSCRIAAALRGLDIMLTPVQQQYYSDDSKNYIKETFAEEKEKAKQLGIWVYLQH